MTLTIFTPTYNRAHLLGRLYESLLKQHSEDFVWLVVDDGSTDNTHDLIQSWQQEGRIPIEYLWQENGGKMRAHNRGVAVCQTPLFFCVDSDDILADGAVDDILKHSPRIWADEHLAGLMGRKWLMNRFPFSSRLTKITASSSKELYAHGFQGETALVFKTDVIKHFPFPEFEDEKYVSLSFAYDEIDRQYKYLLVDNTWMLCEYQPDGYSLNRVKLKQENPKGWTAYYLRKLQWDEGSLMDKWKYTGHYLCFSAMAGNQFRKTVSEAPSRIRTLLCLPLGAFYYYRQQIRYRRRYGHRPA